MFVNNFHLINRCKTLDVYILSIQSMQHYNPYVGKGRNGDVKRVRSETKSPQGGRKKHGSHRSTIIGKYQFKSTPVTELKQPGVIWQ